VRGYYDDDSMIRRVHRERVVALSGSRALLMQAAHPVAFTGFFVSTSSLRDPYARLERTARVIDTVVFGSKQAADRATRRVRATHSRVRGVLDRDAGRFPAGTPWAADDPELLLWIVATLADSGMLVFERYVRRMTRDERERYWQDFRLLGSLFGLAPSDMPATHRELRAYMHEMLTGDVLHVTEQARELGITIVLHPPVPLVLQPLLQLANFVTVGLLPRRLRREYGLAWDPIRGIVHRGGAEYARRLVLPLLPGWARYSPRRLAQPA